EAAGVGTGMPFGDPTLTQPWFTLRGFYQKPKPADIRDHCASQLTVHPETNVAPPLLKQWGQPG
ncbi:hypothetical protein U1Q18_051490, partial [Sarracenia purpurea var. burkii]